MRTTSKNLINLGLAFAFTAGIATTVFATVPNDAGFKARGMKNATVYRTYSTPQLAVPQATGRQSFSYTPSAAATAQTNCPEAAVPAPVATNEVRRFSYEPAATAPVYRTWNSRATVSPRGNYGGSYPSKATLKY